MSRDLAPLLARVGRYGGHGINHEDQPFYGELILAPLLEDRGITLSFRAMGIDGTLYHEEASWIAPDATGLLALWSLNRNSAGVLRHDLRYGAGPRDADATWVFGHGDRSDPEAMRIEVALDLFDGGDVGYRFGWGLPGEAFAPRSNVRMSRQADDAVEE